MTENFVTTKRAMSGKTQKRRKKKTTMKIYAEAAAPTEMTKIHSKTPTLPLN